MDFFELLGVWNTQQIISGVVRLVLAAFCGALIGLDRERRGRPAGLRTHMLVCLGAALVMITGEQIQHTYASSDVTRLGAQVISGIGFLGAGSIIVDRHDRIRGLTTAAGLWTSACIGLAIGAGFYLGGIFACLLTVVIVASFRGIEIRLSKKPRILSLYIECKNTTALYSFISHIAGSDYRIVAFKLIELRQDDEKSPDDERVGANIGLKLSDSAEYHSIMKNLKDFDGLISMQEI